MTVPEELVSLTPGLALESIHRAAKIGGIIETMATDSGMMIKQSNNPLHGVTLEIMVVKLADHYGWDGLAGKIAINCFKNDPSVKSSLKFLRKTPWARAQVEKLYLSTFC